MRALDEKEVEAFRSELLVWVHGCEQRKETSLPLTLQSLDESDAGQVLVTMHGPEVRGTSAIEAWWRDEWRERARSGARWILRVEDDVVVNRHLVWNLATWLAQDEPDFGVGIAYLLNLISHVPDHGFACDARGVVWTKEPRLSGAQIQLVRADLVESIVARVEEAKRACYGGQAGDPRLAEAGGVDFDCSFHLAAAWTDRRIFVHLPSLGQASEGSDQSSLFGCPRGDSHHARHWLGPDWKRQLDWSTDREGEMWHRGSVTRWIVTGEGEVLAVRTPPLLAEVDMGSMGGRSIVLRREHVHETEAAAIAARKARFGW